MTLNIPYTTTNVRTLLAKGHLGLDAEHAARERTLMGKLRAGSAGCIGMDGKVYGECHRIAHARLMGIDKPVEANRKIMFQGGEGNEDLWEKVLVKGYDGQILRKQEVQRTGAWGTVLGSPDLVLADAQGAWQTILELKLVCSTNSAIYKELEGTPDSKHLVQAATYMWLTGVPCVLCYTNRSDFAIEFKRKKYGVTKIEPFYRLMYLTFRDDVLFYRDEFASTEVVTQITGAGIEAFYGMVRGMAATNLLGPRPTNDHVNGQPGGWDRCDSRYCAFAGACESFSDDYYSWLATVRADAEGT